MEHRFPAADHIESGGFDLVGEMHRPAGEGRHRCGLVLCHGFPTSGGDALISAGLPDLATHIADTLGWVVLTFRFRGCNPSGGQFSLSGWLSDLRSAIDELAGDAQVDQVWAAGFGTGGALSICAGALDQRICGVAAISSPADFNDWAAHPDELLEHAREVGAIDTDSGLGDLTDWAEELGAIQAYRSVPSLAPRSLLVLHGAEDQMVPVLDARAICDAHGSAELLVIPGAEHGLRHDPRAVASLLGWLDREAGRSAIDGP